LKQDNRFQIVVRPEAFPAIFSKEPHPADGHEKPSITACRAFLGHPVRVAVIVIDRRTAALPLPVPAALTNGVNPDNMVLSD